MSFSPKPKSKDLRVAFVAGRRTAQNGEPLLAPCVWSKRMRAWFEIGYLSSDDRRMSSELLEAADRQMDREALKELEGVA